MLVRTTAKGHASAVLYVGTRNVKKYFHEHKGMVAFQLDHLCIDCALNPEFWHGHPEIDDPRLSEWLRFKVLKGAATRSPIVLQMIPAGGNCFRLVPGKVTKTTH